MAEGLEVRLLPEREEAEPRQEDLAVLQSGAESAAPAAPDPASMVAGSDGAAGPDAAAEPMAPPTSSNLQDILLFGKLRQPLIIWLTVPLAITGVTAGLFGALSLVGLLIKNAIVLIEEIDQQIADGNPPYNAILDAGVSRMRPVVLAASTTILGLIPLLPDVFFVNMAITMMAGLGFATILTLVIVPTLYAILFGIKKSKAAAG
jgi:hypothetical protein